LLYIPFWPRVPGRIVLLAHNPLFIKVFRPTVINRANLLALPGTVCYVLALGLILANSAGLW